MAPTGLKILPKFCDVVEFGNLTDDFVELVDVVEQDFVAVGHLATSVVAVVDDDDDDDGSKTTFLPFDIDVEMSPTMTSAANSQHLASKSAFS